MSARRLLRPENGHPSSWVQVPEAAFEGNEESYRVYKRRALAVEMYANDVPYDGIRKATGIGKQEVIRFVKTCQRPSGIGVVGMFALIPYQRTKSYERKEPSTGGGKPRLGKENVDRGYSGCCIQFFEEHTTIAEHVHARLTGKLNSSLPEARVPYRTLWKEVLQLAKSAGVSQAEWPFRVQTLGRSAFYAYFRGVVESNTRETDMARHGEAVAKRRRINPIEPPSLPAVRALSLLQLDYAKVDAASVFEIELADGTFLSVAVRRWYWGMLYCPTLKAILGFQVCLSPNPSAEDALDVLESAALGLNQGGLLLDAASGKDGKVILNGFFPDLKGHGISIIQLDNGWANIAQEVLRAIQRVWGCAINLGRVAQPFDRIEIEREFGSITRRGPARLASTYGADPTDSRRGNPNEEAEVNHIRLNDVIRVLTNAVRHGNVLNKAGLFGSNPVRETERLLEKKGSGVFPMPLPRINYPEWVRFAAVERAIVRAGDRHRAVPYLEKWGTTYTNEELQKTDKWIGKTMLLFINRRNANEAIAICAETNEYIGELHVVGRYRDRQHSIFERKQAEASIDRGDIENLSLEEMPEFSAIAENSVAGKARRKRQNRSSRSKSETKSHDKRNADIALDAAKAEQRRQMIGEEAATTVPAPIQQDPSTKKESFETERPRAKVISIQRNKETTEAPPVRRKKNRFGLR
ncbi:hypothetical protein [Burkholderia sp. Ax-1719]|uniref:hypothetical protein n=1 Tax=Burkholderia sp. Ax-1719 TaxID=2608334 RepID=UPI0014248EA2|nr:hypothetical protein [Burkholderia sp. Ax-1719]NIE63060.1 hypothetical protein [Burkholderia sp. Ax-1719]